MKDVKGPLLSNESSLVFSQCDTRNQLYDCLRVSFYENFKADVQIVPGRDVAQWEPFFFFVKIERLVYSPLRQF